MKPGKENYVFNKSEKNDHLAVFLAICQD